VQDTEFKTPVLLREREREREKGRREGREGERERRGFFSNKEQILLKTES
jgi:hypothetical protein